MKNRIGILGGTFNPIHNGHIALALKACEQFELDKVLVMISPNPPHKAGKTILDTGRRIDMLKLAIAPYLNKLEFSDFELLREGYIYTAETLTLLKEQSPENEYYFILGGDSIRDIEHWYKPEIVLKSAVIIVAVRDEMDLDFVNERIDYLTKKYGGDIRVLKNRNIPFSSTQIREFVRNGKSISGMVPETVEEYILKNCLYLNDCGHGFAIT